MKVNGDRQQFGYHILQNTFLCSTEEKNSLEQLESDFKALYCSTVRLYRDLENISW